MKGNKKGFTLIELLAVIIILAVIALIAVPVIMNIINKANKSSFKDTAYGLINAGELYFSEKQLKLETVGSEKTFDLSKDVNTTDGIQIKGEVPKGTLKVNAKGETALAINNGRYCITKSYIDEDIKITEDVTNCYVPYTLQAVATTTSEVTNVESCVKAGTTCEAGTLFAIKVNDSDAYNFYVINDNGSEVTLIMDRNLGEKKEWVSREDYDDNTYGTNGNNNKGPITALEYLNSQTDGWINIPAIQNYTYDNQYDNKLYCAENNYDCTENNYGYQKLEIENGSGKITVQDGSKDIEIEGISRARLITYKEIANLIDNNGTPSYLRDWLRELNSPIYPYGYWLLTTNPLDTQGARVVIFSGVSDIYANRGYTSYNNFYGVRPVITLSK